ncbi:MAG: cytochrome c [Magnetococcus sp. YQC-3]
MLTAPEKSRTPVQGEGGFSREMLPYIQHCQESGEPRTTAQTRNLLKGRECNVVSKEPHPPVFAPACSEMLDLQQVVGLLAEYCDVLQRKGVRSDNPFHKLGNAPLRGIADIRESLLPTRTVHYETRLHGRELERHLSSSTSWPVAHAVPTGSGSSDAAEPVAACSLRKTSRRRPSWLFALAALLAVGLLYALWSILSAPDDPVAVGQEKERGIRPKISPISATQKGDEPKNSNAVTYFRQHGMKHYYCRDYLKRACDDTALPENPLPKDQNSVQDGGVRYFELCVRCHGEAGRGNSPDAMRIRLALRPLGWAGSDMLERDAYLFWVIAEGGSGFGGQMPRFKNLLSEREIWQIIRFIATLR